MNVAEIEVQLADLVRERFDTSEFAFRVLEIYNAPKATVTKLRNGTQKKGDQAGDVLWSRKAYFRAAADGQAAATLDALKDGKATKSQKPRFLIATDGHEVAAHDTKADDTLYCDYDKITSTFSCRSPASRNTKPSRKTQPTLRLPVGSPSCMTKLNVTTPTGWSRGGDTPSISS
jgi:hypothetical protein